MKAYPTGFLKLFWWAAALLTLSGIALIPNMLELRFEWSVPVQLPAGSKVGVAALHAFFAFAMLALLGSLIPIHVRNGLRSRRQLKSGIGLLVIAIGLPLTALGIYYLGDEFWSAAASATHVAIGLLAALVLTIHVVVARRAATQTRKRHPGPRELRAVSELEEHKQRSKIARHANAGRKRIYRR